MIYAETYCFDRATGRCGCPALRLLLKVDDIDWTVIISEGFDARVGYFNERSKWKAYQRNT